MTKCWPGDKVSASTPEDLSSIHLKLVLQWLPCQAPGIIELGLVDYQYTLTGGDTKFDLLFLSQCGSTSNCLSRPRPETE